MEYWVNRSRDPSLMLRMTTWRRYYRAIVIPSEARNLAFGFGDSCNFVPAKQDREGL